MSDQDRSSSAKTVAWVAVAIAGVLALVLLLGCFGAIFFARLAPVSAPAPVSATPSAPAPPPAPATR